MDKKTLLNCLRTRSFSIDNCLEIIIDYCKESKKPEDKINDLVKFLTSNPSILKMIVPNCLPTLIGKYQILTLKDKNENIINYF